MIRLCCVSAAGVAMSSSSESKDDHVDVVTLGAMQPPLAGQARPSGSNAVGKGRGGHVNAVDETERPEDTLERLLRRTLDSALQSTLLDQEQEERTAVEALSAGAAGENDVPGLRDVEQGEQDESGEVEGQSEASTTSGPEHDNEHAENEPGQEDGEGLEPGLFEVQLDVPLEEEGQGQGELEISTSSEAQHPERTARAGVGENEDAGSDAVEAADGMTTAAPDPSAVTPIPAEFFASDGASRAPLVDAGVGGCDAAVASTQEDADVPVSAAEAELTPPAAASSSDGDSDSHSALVTEDVASVSADELDVLEETDGRGVGAETVPTAGTESSPVEEGGETRPGRPVAGPTSAVAHEADSTVDAESITSAETPTDVAPLDVSESGKSPGEADGWGGQGLCAVREGVEGYPVSVEESAMGPEGVAIREQFHAGGAEESADAEGSSLPHLFDPAEEDRSSSSDVFEVRVDGDPAEFAWQQRQLAEPSSPPRHGEHVEAPENLTGKQAPVTANEILALPSADAVDTATSRPEELGRTEPENTGRPGGGNRSPRKLPIFGKPVTSGGIGGEAGEKIPGKLRFPLDDPDAWSLPPFPELGDYTFPLDGQHAEGRETAGMAVAEAEGTAFWRKWGEVCIREAEAAIGRWAMVVREKGAVWSGMVLELCEVKVEEFWRDHLREPVERERRRLEEAWRFVLAEVAEYMADPVLAELL